MTSTINENGFLEIKAENSIEAYALKKWCDDLNTDKINIPIIINVDYK